PPPEIIIAATNTAADIDLRMSTLRLIFQHVAGIEAVWRALWAGTMDHLYFHTAARFVDRRHGRRCVISCRVCRAISRVAKRTGGGSGLTVVVSRRCYVGRYVAALISNHDEAVVSVFYSERCGFTHHLLGDFAHVVECASSPFNYGGVTAQLRYARPDTAGQQERATTAQRQSADDI